MSMTGLLSVPQIPGREEIEASRGDVVQPTLQRIQLLTQQPVLTKEAVYQQPVLTKEPVYQPVLTKEAVPSWQSSETEPDLVMLTEDGVPRDELMIPEGMVVTESGSSAPEAGPAYEDLSSRLDKVAIPYDAATFEQPGMRFEVSPEQVQPVQPQSREAVLEMSPYQDPNGSPIDWQPEEQAPYADQEQQYSDNTTFYDNQQSSAALVPWQPLPEEAPVEEPVYQEPVVDEVERVISELQRDLAYQQQMPQTQLPNLLSPIADDYGVPGAPGYPASEQMAPLEQHQEDPWVTQKVAPPEPSPQEQVKRCAAAGGVWDPVTGDCVPVRIREGQRVLASSYQQEAAMEPAAAASPGPSAAKILGYTALAALSVYGAYSIAKDRGLIK